MALTGLVAANNLSDVTDRERAWSNLGASISIEASLVFNAGRDLFNTPTNPNGVWSYGYTNSLGSTAIVLLVNRNSSGWFGPGGFNTPFFYGTPGAEIISSHTPIISGQEASVLRWTSPISGQIRIEAAFQRSDPSGGNGVIPRIYKEGLLLYDGGVLSDATTVASFANNTTILAGQRINFQVGANGNNNNDAFNYNYVRIFVP